MFEEMYKLKGGNTLSRCCCSTLPLNETAKKFPVNFEALERAQCKKLEQQVVDGTCVAWLAEYKEEIIASGGVSIIKTVAIPEDPNVEVAFLHSVYTEKAMRGQGIAATIIDRLLEHCRIYGLRRVQLNASEAGRELYRKRGFRSLEQAMMLWL